MRRVFLVLLIGVAVIGAAWALASVSGHVSASIGSITIETSASIAILVFVSLVAVTVIILRLLVGLLRIPRAASLWRRRARLRLGERTVTQVLVALAAGEQVSARKAARKAQKLLGDSPQTLLLVAEAARLSGREDEAAEAFRTLTRNKDAAFLGLRGLLRQAIDRQDWSQALTLANQAEAAHPGTIWLRQQRAELALQTDNWAEALELVGPDSKRVTYYIAAAAAEADPSRALNFAKRAWREDQSFAPAVLAYATRLRAAGHETRARSCVIEAWRRAPHPDLATFVLAAENDPLARLQAAKRLVSSNATHTESRLLLARVSLDAGFIAEARHQAEAVRAEGLNQRRLCLLMAEIEEQQGGDTEAGRLAQRNELRRVAVSDPDPSWQCTNCRAESVDWHPKCPSCSSIGTLKWASITHAPAAAVPAIAD